MYLFSTITKTYIIHWRKQMEIVVLDKYLIKSDTYSYMVATRQPKLKGEGFNLLEASYFSTLDKVFKDIMERELRTSDITTLQELSQFLADLSDRITDEIGVVKGAL